MSCLQSNQSHQDINYFNPLASQNIGTKSDSSSAHSTLIIWLSLHSTFRPNQARSLNKWLLSLISSIFLLYFPLYIISMHIRIKVFVIYDDKGGYRRVRLHSDKFVRFFTNGDKSYNGDRGGETEVTE